eukprot:5866325-Pleurochrysis_carterae.AAC.1
MTRPTCVGSLASEQQSWRCRPSIFLGGRCITAPRWAACAASRRSSSSRSTRLPSSTTTPQ